MVETINFKGKEGKFFTNEEFKNLQETVNDYRYLFEELIENGIIEGVI